VGYGKWGFADRYNTTGFLDAAIRSAGNLIFFAEVYLKSSCKEVETRLLWKVKPKYNKAMQTPQRKLRIEHQDKCQISVLCLSPR
jgi:hypothetical protein